MNTASELAKLNRTGNGAQPGSMPDRGTSVGVNGDTYGFDISTDATNRQGGIGGAAKSESALENCACVATVI